MKKEELRELSEMLSSVGESTINRADNYFRRSFSSYYFTWGITVFLIVLISELFQNLTGIAMIIAYVLVPIVLTLSSVYITSKLFSRAFRLMSIKKIMHRDFDFRKLDRLAIITIILFILAFIFNPGFILSRAEIAILDAFVVALVAYYAYSLQKLLFTRIPPEGIAAVSVILVSDVLNTVASLLHTSAIYGFLSWMPLVVIFLAASVYSMSRKSVLPSGETEDAAA